jgi:hypothetical protein
LGNPSWHSLDTCTRMVRLQQSPCVCSLSQPHYSKVHLQGSFHPARTWLRSVPARKMQPDPPATRQFRILGKSFRATMTLVRRPRQTGRLHFSRCQVQLHAGLMLLCLWCAEPQVSIRYSIFPLRTSAYLIPSLSVEITLSEGRKLLLIFGRLIDKPSGSTTPRASHDGKTLYFTIVTCVPMK